ncbi:MAG TPA: Asp-tRNA(Asn)/Glu-tRNA(Gln) amidotransferase subunit GatA [Vicinamibacterales bacterium]
MTGQRVATALARAAALGAGRDGLNIIIAENRDAERDESRALTLAGDDRTRPLRGVPVAIKDNIATGSLPTTCGSRILEGYVSPYQATAVARLREAGAVVLCTTNMDEFAMGSSTEHSAYGPTRNPLDSTRVPGGSSGGSAAAVAAGIVSIALGSETGGSVRQPASFCGVVGIKPTYGRVSRFGLVAFASSLDQVGVLGRTVADAALGLRVIAGRDASDATSADVPVPDYVAAARRSSDSRRPLNGITIGRPREYFPSAMNAGVQSRCDAALAALRDLGAVIRDVSLPHTDFAIPVYYIVAPAEASSNLARFDGVRYGLRMDADSLATMYERTRSVGFGTEVTRRVLLGTYVLSSGYYDAYYKRAQEVRALVANDFQRVFADGVDLLFTPTTPTPAFRIGEISDPYQMYLNDIFTATANLAGVPAISVPIGLTQGLPVGGQLIAPHFGEERMIAAAAALEQALSIAPATPVASVGSGR